MSNDNTANSVCRRIDEIGRIMIPASFRKKHDLTEGTLVNITSCDDGSLRITKAVPACSFCGSETDLIPVRAKYICKSCLAEANVLGQ